MGEYAKRADGQEIKIGTCESMYYLRFEDRHKVFAVPNSINVNNLVHLNGLRFRVPFIDENPLQPGEYQEFNRGLRLYKVLPCEWCKGTGIISNPDIECTRCHGAKTYGHEDYCPADVAPGRMHFRHNKAGLQITVPCYHGVKLPDLGDGCSAHWNGKGWAFELAFLKSIVTDGEIEIFPVIRCRFCEEEWRTDWADIADYIPTDYQFLLERYAPEPATV